MWYMPEPLPGRHEEMGSKHFCVHGLLMVAVVRTFWVAVKELKLSYYIGETLLFTIYTHYGNLI